MARHGYINITGEIGYDTTLETVRAQVVSQPDAESFLMLIDSHGGSVFEGLKIYDYLKLLNKPIKARVIGFQASMATVIGLAASEITASSHSEHLYHLPSASIDGTTDDISQKLQVLQRIENKIISIYQEKTGKSADEIRALLKRDTPISSQEALAFGLIDKIDDTMKAVAKYDLEKFQGFNSNTNNNYMSKVNKTIAEIFKNISDALASSADVSDGGITNKVKVETESGEPEVGARVTIDGQPAPDGNHTLDDGTVIVVNGGIITEIILPETIDSLKNRLNAMEQENNDLKAQLEALKTVEAKNKSLEASLKKVVDEFQLLKESLERDLPANIYSKLVLGVDKSQTFNPKSNTNHPIDEKAQFAKNIASAFGLI